LVEVDPALPRFGTDDLITTAIRVIPRSRQLVRLSISRRCKP